MNNCICCCCCWCKPNVIKTPLANGLSTFTIKHKPVFNNGCKSTPRIPPDCRLKSNWVFENFILAEELFAKALRSFKICVLVNSNLWGKLMSTLDESLKVTSVPFFIPDFNLFSYSLNTFTFKVLYWVIFYWCYIKAE